MTVERSLAVCMITSLFYPIIGGAERQAQQLAARLIRNGVEVCILTRRYKRLKAYEEIDNIPVHRILTIGKGLLASLTYTLFCLFWLFKNGQNYRILHCHLLYSPTTIGALAKILWGKQLLVKVAGSGKYGGISGVEQLPFQRIRRIFFNQVDVFVIVNEEAKSELRRWGVENAKLRKIPNGVDTDEFKPVVAESKIALRRKLGLPLERSVIFTGRLDPAKGLDTLLYAWQKMVVITLDTRLLILGEGQERPHLIELADQLGIQDHVSFLGRKENVREYLQAADVFVLPSISEGQSNSLLEAMATGLAVVATDVGGNKEVIVTGENGVLVEQGNPEQLAKALLGLLQDGDLATRLGENARKTIEEKYSIERMVQQYLRLYQVILRQE